MMRNMRSVGIELSPWVEKGLLRFHAVRATFYSLEMHLAVLHKLVEEFKPKVIVIDPLTTFLSEGDKNEVKAMLTRLIDIMKSQQITAMFTSLTSGGLTNLEQTDLGVSSIMDTWLFLRDIETNGERNRGLYVLKSRGMAHSNQIREFLLTNHGIELVDVYVGPGGVLTGTARQSLEAQEKSAALKRRQEIERQRRDLVAKRETFEARMAALRAEFEVETHEIEKSIAAAEGSERLLIDERRTMARLRKAEIASNGRRTV
jgi:circadian clock protein KaiC